MSLTNPIGSHWTLFLDRDGVINKKLDGYVTKPSEFVFLPKVLDALSVLSGLFHRILIVTNQQGIGKELMTHDDLHSVHSHMLRNINLAGGRIDNIYYCPNLSHEDAPCRKPNPGMAFHAQQDFEDIDFLESIMIGDSDSDIEFGNLLGMTTVKIGGVPDQYADMTCSSLTDFITYLDID